MNQINTKFVFNNRIKFKNTCKRKRKNKANVAGVYTVEFAIVGSLFFLLFFAAIEIARLMFTWNVLTEVSRRGARLATVCNILESPGVDNQSIIQPTGVASLSSFDGKNMLPNLNANNLQISYLKLNGTQASNFTDIVLVRVEIINYQHELIIPGMSIILNSPSFSTTLPRESLGVSPFAYTDC